MCQDQGHALLVVQARILTERNAELTRLLDAERARSTAPRQPGRSTPYCPPAPPGGRHVQSPR